MTRKYVWSDTPRLQGVTCCNEHMKCHVGFWSRAVSRLMPTESGYVSRYNRQVSHWILVLWRWRGQDLVDVLDEDAEGVEG